MNAPHRNQSVPIISVIKRLGSPDGDDMDILVPQVGRKCTGHVRRRKHWMRCVCRTAAAWRVRGVVGHHMPTMASARAAVRVSCMGVVRGTKS